MKMWVFLWFLCWTQSQRPVSAEVMLCPADVATRTFGGFGDTPGPPGKALVGHFEHRRQRWQMELCSGEGSRAKGGSLVMEVVKGFHGPPNLGEGTWILRGTIWRQG